MSSLGNHLVPCASILLFLWSMLSLTLLGLENRPMVFEGLQESESRIREISWEFLFSVVLSIQVPCISLKRVVNSSLDMASSE